MNQTDKINLILTILNGPNRYGLDKLTREMNLILTEWTEPIWIGQKNQRDEPYTD